MISKIVGSRLAIVLLLVAVIVVNLLFVRYNEQSTTPVNSKEGLDAAIDKVMSDEYSATLKEELLKAQKPELLKEVKEELREEFKSKIYGEMQQSIEQSVRESLAAEVRADLVKEYTEKYYKLRQLNYGVLREMELAYYKENKDVFKNLIGLEALDRVVENEPGKKQLKEKVAKEIDAYASRKDWYNFILRDFIKESALKMGPLTEKEEGVDITGCEFATSFPTYDEEFLSRVKFSEERMNDFTTNHDKLVAKLLMLDPPSPHISSGEGIVISGGGAYMAGAMSTIVQVREMGSKLPIELIINYETEYDAYICETLGKRFNFRCLIIEREIGKEVIEELKITKFQLKIVGLLVTSFDHIISLDADNMPLKNPDLIFTSESYLNTEFLLWPDLWQRTVSLTYYQIAGLQPGEPVDIQGWESGKSTEEYFRKGREKVHFHDLAGIPGHISTETGQMAFSKRRHYRSFILALYYNIYGETHYWRMFYQGSPGIGDRDTFVPALHVFNEPYHVVERATWLAGFKEESGRFQETTIVQYDPVSSLKFDRAWRQWLIEKGLDLRLHFNKKGDFTAGLVEEFKKLDKGVPEPEVFFLHVHRPKVNPVLATDPEGYFDWNHQRNLGLPGVYESSFGKTDWDLKFYTIAEWVACSGIKSDTWWKSVKRDQKKVCNAMKEYVKFLKKDSTDESAQVFKNVVLN